MEALVWPYAHQCLIVRFINTISVEITESMKQVIQIVKHVSVLMELLIIHANGCTDKDEINRVVAFKGLVVHVALQRAGYIVIRSFRQIQGD